jgi:hypothetical protein
MGSSSSPTRTTQVTEPPAFIQPYMQYGAEQSRGLYETGGPDYYPGNTVVPFAPQTEAALGMTEHRALQGSPVVGAAQNYAANTLNTAPSSQFGSAANPYASGANPYGSGNNPHLDATFNRAADSVQNRLQSGFAGSGRNIEAARPAAALEMNDLAAQIYGGDYSNERNRQLAYGQQQLGIGASGYESERERMASDLDRQRSMQFGVAGLAPQLANQDYVDINALQSVGGQVEDLSGRLMEDQAARWDYSQNAPQINLDNYLARVTGAYPGQNATATTPTYRNRTAGAAGGAMAGAQLGSQIYPGWGTAIGAVAGGLLGGWG